jgi:hypothetical protein
MKLVLYDNSNIAVKTIENIRSPIVDGNSIEWEDGSLSGINLPFLLLDDNVLVEELTEEIIALDKKDQFMKADIAKENADLKERLSLMQKAIDDLILTGGGL